MLRASRKVAVGLGLLAIAAGLMWRGAGIVAERMNRVESSPVCFADSDLAARQLTAANHAPATRGGSFVADAVIGRSNVRGVRMWVDTGPDH